MKYLTLNRRGFTILELLVVIFIMMVMTGVAVASFRRFLDTERIKLAGGQLISSISMARQYAMSKRTRMMVEFVEPAPPTEIKSVTFTPILQAFIKGGYNFRSKTSETLGSTNTTVAYSSNAYNGSTAILYKFDLSSLPAYTAVIAKLKLNFVHNYDLAVTVDQISLTDWTTAANWYNYVAGSLLAMDVDPISSITVTSAEPTFEIDVSSQTSITIEEGLMSIRVIGSGGTNRDWMSDNTQLSSCKLVVEWEEVIGEPAETEPRGVVLIPFLKMHNTTTGGFDWVVDSDSGALKRVDLPRNVHYKLLPQGEVIPQYDPGVLPELKSNTLKVFMTMNPDGTCSAGSPSQVGWEHRRNVIVMRDMSTGDVALLYVPPSSSSVRQRYLFGDEVEAFELAYSDCALW
jgi:Tfp pilus assembly protein PilE